MPFGPDYVGQYCSSGLWQDLTPYMKSSRRLDLELRAGGGHLHELRRQAVRAAVADRRLRPLLQHHIASDDAGHPRAAQDDGRADGGRQEAHREELRRLDQDGRLRPAQRLQRARRRRPGRAPGARSGSTRTDKAQIATDPGWTSAFMWQTPADRLVRLRQHRQVRRAPTRRREFNTGNAFEHGQIAMVFDGEWRTAFIGRDVPGLRLRHRAVPGSRSQRLRRGQGRRHRRRASPRAPSTRIRPGSW